MRLLCSTQSLLRLVPVFASLVHAAPQIVDAAAAKPSVVVGGVGTLVGTTTVVGAAKVTKYAGVPYAASPPQRFGPPKAAASHVKPYVATSTRAACPQNFGMPGQMQDREKALFNNPGYPAPAESEDCMYLNIYLPPGSKRGDGKAVLFWVFGGNLAFGTGGLHQYDGSSFAANQDVIVVTHNYRTNVFGFPGSPELNSPDQNPGFLDQRFALNWVYKHIAAFGGDPSKITIFGESAGGYSVKNLLALPPSPLPFHGAIMESEAAIQESATLVFPYSNTSVETSWEQLVVALDCTVSTSQIACVRSKSTTDVVNAVQNNGLSFFPVVDGITHVSDVRPAITGGTAAPVPFMIGTNQDEGRPFIYLLDGEDEDIALATLLTAIFPNNPALVATLETMFPGKSAYEAASTVLTQSSFLCPASQLATLGHSNGHQVFRYLFNASFPNQALFPDPGVWHSSEITEVYGTYDVSNALGAATTQQIQLSKYMQKAWANFAKDPTLGPQQGWPELGAAGNVQDLGGNGINGGKTVLASSIDQSCELFNPVIDEEGL